MINKLNISISSLVIALTLVAPQLSYGSNGQQIGEESSPKSAPRLPSFLDVIIVTQDDVKQVPKDNLLTNGAPTNNKCSQTDSEVSNLFKELKWNISVGSRFRTTDKNTYQTFVNAGLIYRPDPGSDERMITLRTKDPFGTYDLSRCGDTHKYLNITKDIELFWQVDKQNPKLNILLAPYDLIKNYLDTTTKNFKGIMQYWNKDTAPGAIFWRWGGEENFGNFAYLISASLIDISSDNLYRSCPSTEGRVEWTEGAWRSAWRFHVHLLPKMTVIDENLR